MYMVPVCTASIKLPCQFTGYSRGRCTSWRRHGAGVVHWRVLGRNSVACPRGRVLGCPARPGASLRKRARWRPRRRSGSGGNAHRTPRCGSARAATPPGPSPRSSACAGSAAAAGTTRRNRSHGPALLFRTRTAAWRNFLKGEKENVIHHHYGLYPFKLFNLKKKNVIFKFTQ